MKKEEARQGIVDKIKKLKEDISILQGEMQWYAGVGRSIIRCDIDKKTDELSFYKSMLRDIDKLIISDPTISIKVEVTINRG